jgi:hypothetical protein
MRRRRLVGWSSALLVSVAVSARAVDAPLSPGKPVNPGVPSTFSGVGGTGASGGAHNALSAFEAAIGGVNNGGTASPQAGGFRTINWDAVALDGTDFGGDGTVIAAGTTVGIPVNRFESRGVFFEEVYAVSGDGFLGVNPAASGLFPAFSPSNTFAMFNGNTIGLRFVPAAAPDAAPGVAATQGFGAVFRNVRTANTTSIEYFNGVTSLGKFFAPTSVTSGDPEFLGVLYGSPVVTSVTITCGTESLFGFDGATATATGTNSPPTHNLVVTDDFVYAEPTAPANAAAGIAATAGTAFTGVVSSFTDGDALGLALDFTATIDWGDGHISAGTMAGSGVAGFDVSGTHTYDAAGTFAVRTDVADFGGAAATLANTATVAAAPTTTTTLPCAGEDLDAVACLLAELPSPACAGAAVPSRLTALVAAARTLVGRAASASGKHRKPLVAKLTRLLGHAIATVAPVHDATGACPASLASLLADARARAAAAP